MRRRGISLALTLSVLLAACGGGGGEGDVTATAPAVGTQAEPVGSEQPAADGTEANKSEAELSLPDAVADDGDDATEPTGPPTEGLPGGRYVQIADITTEGQAYAVTFEPLNFTPIIGSAPEEYHVHFFFDTLEPENAGTNGPAPGEWFLYDGPSPFTGYTFADRPPAATQLCALVADFSHGVTVGSGNCAALP